jgi:hypothetical protein
MHFNVSVQLLPGENFKMDPEAAGLAVMEALGGDPKSDICNVSIASAPQLATVGVVPGLPEAPAEG